MYTGDIKMKRQIEIRCGNYSDALNAQNGGASRIILSNGLYLGGLTPSIGTLLKVKENTDLEVICLVRPRTAGFYYNDDEFETMMLDAEVLLDNGADGIAFGFLDEECDIDIVHTRKMVDLIHSYHKKAFFNQAIDCVYDIDKTMCILITVGVEGIYTSGQQKNALKGKEMIHYLQDTYGQGIEVIAVEGINVDNLTKYMDNTGIFIYQTACLDWDIDPTTVKADGLFDYHDGEFEKVNWELVEAYVDEVEDDLYDFEIV